MQLTRFTDYGLRTLLYLASRPEEKATARELADFYQVSYNHIIKVVHQLATLGFINSTKGRGGGLRLARDPSDIFVGEVVRRMEPGFMLVDCFGATAHKPCVIVDQCRLRGLFDSAVNDFLRSLDRYSLAELLPPVGEHRETILPIEAITNRKS